MDTWITFVNTAKTAKVHLIRTVEDNNIFSKTPAHVFDSLRLACPSWASRCPSHRHAQSLGQSDVTPEQSDYV